MAALLQFLLRVPKPRLSNVRRFSRSLSANSAETSPQDIDDYRAEEDNDDCLLYKEHIRTTFFQKALLSVGSAAMSLLDPSRDGDSLNKIIKGVTHLEMPADMSRAGLATTWPTEGNRILAPPNNQKRFYCKTKEMAYCRLSPPGDHSATPWANPDCCDMIAVLGETTGKRALRKMRDQMAADEEGRAILRYRPRINSNTLDYDYMKSLPSNTLAAAYLKFLSDNGVSPDTRQPVHFVDDEELAYVVQRYREVHDMVHTVLNMPTNMLGEVAVKWVEAIQTGLPMCIGGAVFGPIRLSKRQRELYTQYYLPWALRCGYQSKPLINLYYERHWEEPMDHLRHRMGIPELKVGGLHK